MRYFAFLLIVISFVACDKTETGGDVEDCILEQFPDAVKISDEEKAETCIYQEVYAYQGEITYVLTCCVCDLAHIIYHCDGSPLCDFDSECHTEFFAVAEYRYAIVSE